jgi:hypothetical protein
MKMNKLMYATAVFGVLAIGIGSALAQSHSGNHMDHGGTTHNKIDSKTPTLPGQDAFGAIQEIVSILESDPSTDWDKVDISGLRAHLVDMDLVVKNTSVITKNIKGGLEINVSGPDRTLSAVQSMIPAHAPMIDGTNGWVVKSKKTNTGAKLIVTSTNAKEIAHIRGLGFYGLMVTDSHHQSHHLSIARGVKVHGH